MKSLQERTYHYLVENTAIALEITPFFAAYETFVVGMSTEVSLHARVIGAGALYAGLGTVFNKGRDLSQKYFKISERHPFSQPLHDIGYNAVFSGIVSPGFYIASGETDIDKIILGTVGGAALGMANGAIVGYVLDIFKDVTGVKPCKRPSYPESIRGASPLTKRACALGLLLGSAALTYEVYSFHTTSLEQIVSIEQKK